jgi:hypothetical protein
MTSDEAKKQKIESYRCYFRAFSGKLNFAPSTDNSVWYQITNVPILNGSSQIVINRGNGGDSVGVVTTWELPSINDLTSQQITDIKAAVAASEWREDIRATMWVGKAIAPILRLDVKDDKTNLARLIKKLLYDKVLKTIPGKTSERKPCLFVVNFDENALVEPAR